MQIFQRVWNNLNSLRVLVVGLVLVCFTIIILSWASFLDSQRVKQQANDEIGQFAIYKDSALGVNISYPRTWNLQTQVRRDATYEDPKIGVGKIPDLSEFVVEISDGNTQVQFLQFFGNLAKSYRLLEQKSVHTRVGEKLIRYSSTDQKDWFYVMEVNCAEVNLTKRNETDICVSDFYPGFVKDMPSRLKVTGRLNSEIWPIADRIALSGITSN